MTLSSTNNKISHSGDGATKSPFSFPFLFFADEDLTVILRSAGGAETLQVLNTDYTVTGAGTDSGFVSMVAAPAVGETLVVLREVAATQGVDYRSGDPFPADTHETALDRLTMLAQQIQEQLTRTPSVSKTDQATSLVLPNDVTRANKLFAFDAGGNAIAATLVGTSRGVWATATGYNQRDIVSESGSLYFCEEMHTSGVFATDLAAGRWSLLIDAADITGPQGPAGSDGTDGADGVFSGGEATVTPALDDNLAIYDTSDGANPKQATISSVLALQDARQIGEVVMWAGAAGSVPSRWLICDGRAVSRTTYSALFAVVSTTYGVGDGSTTFNLPDLRARVPVGVNDGTLPAGANGSFTTRALAATGGAETHALTEAEMPSHTHSISVRNSTGSTSVVAGGILAGGQGSVATGSSGSDASHNNMQPFVVLNYMIFAGA